MHTLRHPAGGNPNLGIYPVGGCFEFVFGLCAMLEANSWIPFGSKPRDESSQQRLLRTGNCSRSQSPPGSLTLPESTRNVAVGLVLAEPFFAWKIRVESPRGGWSIARLRGHSKQRFGSSWQFTYQANPAEHSQQCIRQPIGLAQNNPIQTGDSNHEPSSPFSSVTKKCSLSHTGEQRQRALQKYHLRESYSSDRRCQAVTPANSEKIGGFHPGTKVIAIGKVHRLVTTPLFVLSIIIDGFPAQGPGNCALNCAGSGEKIMDGRGSVVRAASVNLRAARELAGALILIGSCLASGPAVWGQDERLWAASVAEAQQTAAQRRCLVLLHFWDYNCPPCTKVERNVFSSPDVTRALATNYVAVRVNVSASAQLARQYQIRQWPTDVIITPDGRELYRGVSQQDPTRFLAQLDGVAAKSRVRNQAVDSIAARQLPFSSAEGTQMGTRDPLLVAQNEQNWEYSSQSRGSGGPNYRSREQEAGGRAAAQAVAAAAGEGELHSRPDAIPASANGDAGPRVQNGSYLGAKTIDSYRSRWEKAGEPAIPALPAREPALDVRRPAPVDASAAAADLNSKHRSAPPDQGPRAPIANPHVHPSPSRGAVPGAANEQSLPAGPSANAALRSRDTSAARDTPGPSVPPPPQVDEMQPPLALDGYCPVTLVEQNRMVKGDPQFGARHRGRTYIFADAAASEKFFADPDRYSPMFSGYDPVQLLESHKWVLGHHKHGLRIGTRIFLFSSEQTLQQFWNEQERWLPVSEQAMRELSAGIRR